MKMKTKTTGRYNIFFVILIVLIFGMFVFFSVYTMLYGDDPADDAPESHGNIVGDAALSVPPPVQSDIELNPRDAEDSVPYTNASDPIDTMQNPTDPPPPPAPAELRVTFTGTGDNVVHECLWMDAQKRALPDGRAFNFKPMFADVAGMIASADIAFINQETMMAGDGFALSGYPLFNSPQELGYDLAELGFDVINLANNHMIDKGQTGFINTVNFLRSLGVTVIGDYLNRDELYDLEMKVVERNGIRVAFLAYTYSTNGLVLPAGSEIVIPYYNNDELIISQIAKAKEIADAVIVSIHWGDEDSFTPNATQKRLAQLMTDHGVLAIIGHHPHVLQPIEWIEGSGGNKTLCVYSLGNLASGMIRPMNMVGGFINFDIVKRGETVALENPVFTPTIYYYARSWFDGHVYLLEDYTPELAGSHGTRTRHGFERSVDDLWGYVTRNIDAEFLK